MVFDPAKFPEGSSVRIASRAVLDEFYHSWKLHHKLEPTQLEYSERSAIVEHSYMYHGGDVIYALQGIPGLWHERLLSEESLLDTKKSPAEHDQDR